MNNDIRSVAIIACASATRPMLRHRRRPVGCSSFVQYLRWNRSRDRMSSHGHTAWLKRTRLLLGQNTRCRTTRKRYAEHKQNSHGYTAEHCNAFGREFFSPVHSFPNWNRRRPHRAVWFRHELNEHWCRRARAEGLALLCLGKFSLLSTTFSLLERCSGRRVFYRRV